MMLELPSGDIIDLTLVIAITRPFPEVYPHYLVIRFATQYYISKLVLNFDTPEARDATFLVIKSQFVTKPIGGK